MFKRTILIMVVLVVAGAMFWLSRNYKLVRVEPTNPKQTQVSGNSPRQTADSLDIQDTGTQIPESARHAAGAVEQHRQASQAKLNQAIRDQEAKVEARRKVLSDIVRTKGIIYTGTGLDSSQVTENEAQRRRNALQMYHQSEQEKIQIESQLACLQKYGDDQLMVYAAGLEMPDNAVSKLYPQYLEATRDLEALKINGVGEKHPTMIAAVGRINALKRQLEDGVVNLRTTLKAQLDLVAERLESAEVMKNQTRNDAIQRGLDAQDYVDAKKDFETDQQLLQQMKLKQASENANEKAGR